MNIFSKHPWGWSVFVFWILWYWFLIECDPIYGYFHERTCKGSINGLVFFFPWLVTLAVFTGYQVAGKRSNSAFWKGYYVGRQSEKQQLPYNQIPEDAEEVDFEHWSPEHTRQNNK